MRTLVFILAMFAAFPAFGQVVPSRDRGIWSTGQCDNRHDGIFLGRDFGLIYRVENRRLPTITFGRVVWANGLAMMYVNDRPVLLPVLQTLRSCETMPPTSYASVGEALALLKATDDIIAQCAEGDGLRCAGAAFDFADVSSDSRISLAEVNRVVRALAVFVAYQGVIETRAGQNERYSVEVEVGQLLSTSVFLSLLGPTLTTNLVTSYDFDGDGFLSFEEITQDREPLFAMAPVDGTGQVIGTAAATAVLSATMRFLVGNASQLGGSMLGGLFR